MKKIALAFVFGFLFHKAVNLAHDYAFYSAFDSESCKDNMSSGGSLSARFKCTEENMGIAYYFKFILMRPTPPNRGFGEDTWTY